MMVDEPRFEQERLAKVLNHPVRQRIIELLGTRGSLSWKELSSELGVGTGALYYHIDTLEGIVSRGPEKSYTLTKPGKDVFDYLQHNTLSNPGQPIPLVLAPPGRGLRFFSAVFWPRSIIHALTSSTSRSAASLLVFSAVYLAGELRYGNSLTLLLLWPASGWLRIVASYVASVAILTGVTYAAARLFFGARPGVTQLASACAFCLIPVMVFMALTSSPFNLISLRGNRTVFTVFLVLFQSWSASFLGAGVSVSAGVRIEKSILVSLFVLYATAIVLFLQGSIA